MRATILAAALVLAPFLPATALAQTPPPGLPEFHEVDADHDGRVSLREVLAWARGRSAAVAPFRIADVDRDGDGVLTPGEFKAAGITGFEGLGAIRARDLDITGDGYVSREDLDRYFARRHREAFAKADADRDGSLKPSEFVLLRFN